ncbi:MAG: hypothetical protein A2231_12630 [Candidatus Firestonebacteria bacterium RIFOXYA2_FULL_40_8]|nr:MAG: hypothetical protein A2231_12630 [Candidatus Firestonebacteria bacterium RIFOXYA2_FULL_40_8]
MGIINVHSHASLNRDKKPVISGMLAGEYVAYCKKNNIEKTCVSGVGDELGKEGNKIILSLIKDYPDFFIGMISTDIDRLKGKEIQELNKKGFKGIKLIAPKYNYDDERYFEIYSTAEKLSMPILFHTGYLSPAVKFEKKTISCERMQPVHLDSISRTFPDLKIIGAHMSTLSYFWQAIEITAKVKNVYYDLTGGTVRMMSLPFLKMAFSKGEKMNLESEKEVLREELIEKFVYGSDNPDPVELLRFYNNMFRLLGVKEEIREKVLSSNAKKLFNLA